MTAVCHGSIISGLVGGLSSRQEETMRVFTGYGEEDGVVVVVLQEAVDCGFCTEGNSKCRSYKKLKIKAE